ncbi:hypothetical protein [Enterobacter wuhouensis]|uniref:hypothetical protein n=1 Tax=Enterobacter wuhouensis TaxID=2529381 RepID=UPI003523739E
MSETLGGYGPTAGDYQGGTGANLNEHADTSTPGGGGTGNSGNHDTGGASTGESAQAASRYNWASPTDLVSSFLVNAAIYEALESGLARGTPAALDLPGYKRMRAAFDALPVSQQPTARAQINAASAKAHSVIPDKLTSEHETGGQNGHTVTITVDNVLKHNLQALATAIAAYLQAALTKWQTQANADAAALAKANTAAAAARTMAINTAKTAGAKQTVATAQANLNSATTAATAAKNTATGAVNNATAKNTAANNANTSAKTAETALNTLMQKVTDLVTKDGQYGYYESHTTGGKNEHSRITSLISSALWATDPREVVKDFTKSFTK